jgi:hypothetical protein
MSRVEAVNGMYVSNVSPSDTRLFTVLSTDTDPDLDPATFSLGDARVDRHHQAVDLRIGVDGPADLRYPECHIDVREQREGESVLVVVKQTLWLTDDDCVEAPLRIGQQR